MIDEHAQFGLAIKNARLDYGLTQEELSERAGITCRYLIAIENEGRQVQENSERAQLIRILEAIVHSQLQYFF